MTLSEKAKGKQRAVERECGRDEQERVIQQPREVTIRFTNGQRDLLVKLEPSDVVKDVKKTVRLFPVYSC